MKIYNVINRETGYGDKVTRVLVRDCDSKEIILRRNESGEWIFLNA